MRLLAVCTLFLATSSAASGNMILNLIAPPDLTFTLSPTIEFFPPGAPAATCQTNGTSALCVQFSGTLTDTDTDLSIISLNSLSINLNPTFFTEDNTFLNDVPGALSGDPNAATDGNPFPNSYTGPIFGVDIAANTPPGVYNGIAEISASGGTQDPNGNGFTVDAAFTIVVSPEPVSTGLVLAGLLLLIGARHYRFTRC